MSPAKCLQRPLRYSGESYNGPALQCGRRSGGALGKRTIPRYSEKPGSLPVIARRPSRSWDAVSPTVQRAQLGEDREYLDRARMAGRGWPDEAGPGWRRWRTSMADRISVLRPAWLARAAGIAAPGRRICLRSRASGSCRTAGGDQQAAVPRCGAPIWSRQRPGLAAPWRARSAASAARDSRPPLPHAAQFGVRRSRRTQGRGPRHPHPTRSPRWPGYASAGRPPPGALASECS